jgi:hypothetical protein
MGEEMAKKYPLTATVDEGSFTPVQGTSLVNVVANDTRADFNPQAADYQPGYTWDGKTVTGQGITILSLGEDACGCASIEDNQIRITPKPGSVGSYAVEYTVSDGFSVKTGALYYGVTPA